MEYNRRYYFFYGETDHRGSPLSIACGALRILLTRF